MDDFQLIIYIVFLLLYFLTRGLSKKKKKKERQGREQPSSEQDTTPKTFEDLLKEISGKDEPDVRKEMQEETAEKKAEPDYGFGTEYPSDEEIDEVYKESIEKAKDIKTIDEIVDLDADIPRLKFKEYDTEKIEKPPLAAEIAESLKNPDDARKAIILKEILDRKF